MKNILITMLKGSACSLSVSSASHKDQARSNIASVSMCVTSENMSHCVPQLPLPKCFCKKCQCSVWLTVTLFTVGPVLINFQAENILLELFLGLSAGPQLLHINTPVIQDGSSYWYKCPLWFLKLQSIVIYNVYIIFIYNIIYIIPLWIQGVHWCPPIL